MMTTARDAQWLSMHLYFDGDIYSPVGDRVLLEVIVPLLDQLGDGVQRWFFIRYSDDGAHLRWRISGAEPWLDRHVRPIVERAATASPLVIHHRFVPYEPELERYGGIRGVALAERLFHSSSRAAVELLRKIEPDDRNRRFGKALLAMLIQLHVLIGHRQAAAVSMHGYSRGYLLRFPDAQHRAMRRAFERGLNRQDHLTTSIEQLWAALGRDDRLTPELDELRLELRVVARSLADVLEPAAHDPGSAGSGKPGRPDPLGRLIGSYLHMMNNRLGISIAEECYLATLIHKVLGRVPDMKSAAIPP